MKNTPTDRAMQLVDALMDSFDHAYKSHMLGQSEEAIMLTLDIIAAGSNMTDAIAEAHRKVVKTAVSAVDTKVIWPLAHATLRRQLVRHAKELLGKD